LIFHEILVLYFLKLRLIYQEVSEQIYENVTNKLLNILLLSPINSYELRGLRVFGSCAKKIIILL
tara:strand:+ start:1791 stop:1985 length:195 start_codon:yes stop_codon:yes gene_type:complete